MPGYFSRVVPRSVRVCSDVPGGTYARVVPDEERGVVKKMAETCHLLVCWCMLRRPAWHSGPPPTATASATATATATSLGLGLHQPPPQPAPASASATVSQYQMLVALQSAFSCEGSRLPTTRSALLPVSFPLHSLGIASPAGQPALCF